MKEKKPKPLLLLTGCINPKGMGFTKLQDPVVRKQHYIDAIRFYINSTTCNILFVENSGVDISSEFAQEVAYKRVEILTFEGNDYSRDLGKGFGELLICEYAMKHSHLIKTTEFIIKITGRYQILNVNSILNQYQQLDSCDILIDINRGLSYSDSRIWGASPLFISNILINFIGEINDSKNHYFEHVLCKAALAAISRGYRYYPLNFKPYYIGVNGTDNASYNTSKVAWWLKNLTYLVNYRIFMYSITKYPPSN